MRYPMRYIEAPCAAPPQEGDRDVALNVEQLLFNILLAVIFSLLGFALLFAGYRAFDALTPMDLGHKIFDEGNVAAAVMAGAFVLGIALVVAASIQG
jgi:uncharacterized membrane protein YjfL (UPF0719 family)